MIKARFSTGISIVRYCALRTNKQREARVVAVATAGVVVPADGDKLSVLSNTIVHACLGVWGRIRRCADMKSEEMNLGFSHRSPRRQRTSTLGVFVVAAEGAMYQSESKGGIKEGKQRFTAA